jgi:hypothetical protein
MSVEDIKDKEVTRKLQAPKNDGGPTSHFICAAALASNAAKVPVLLTPNKISQLTAMRKLPQSLTTLAAPTSVPISTMLPREVSSAAAVWRPFSSPPSIHVAWRLAMPVRRSGAREFGEKRK